MWNKIAFKIVSLGKTKSLNKSILKYNHTKSIGDETYGN